MYIYKYIYIYIYTYIPTEKYIYKDRNTLKHLLAYKGRRRIQCDYSIAQQ